MLKIQNRVTQVLSLSIISVAISSCAMQKDVLFLKYLCMEDGALTLTLVLVISTPKT